MMCYKDKTFCTYYETCQDGKDCFRALTVAVRSEAGSFNMAIAQFTDKPECYKELEDE